jgi:hypothetical protein
MDTVIDVIAVGIALAALVISWRVARRQTVIQEIEEARRAEELEARRRARVTASMSRSERGEIRLGGSRTVVQPSQTRLVVHNGGPALARGVEVDVEEGPQPILLEVLPVDLQPGQPMTFPVPVALGDAPTMRVTVRWTDEAGPHEEPFTLQVY